MHNNTILNNKNIVNFKAGAGPRKKVTSQIMENLGDRVKRQADLVLKRERPFKKGEPVTGSVMDALRERVAEQRGVVDSFRK